MLVVVPVGAHGASSTADRENPARSDVQDRGQRRGAAGGGRSGLQERRKRREERGRQRERRMELSCSQAGLN